MDRLRLTDIEPAEPAHPPAHDAGVLAPAPPAAQILLLQRQAGNQAVARMLGARAAPRAVARVTQTAVLTAVGSGGGSDAGPPGALTADPDADFNPWSIVHDLRRAIDQAEISEWDPESKVMRPTKRKVDAGLVMRVLDGLTADQVARVKRIYETQEKTTLENDLFEGGQSNAQSSLKPDQRARIKVLLEGTAQKAGGGASENRLEALAIELHELLAGSLDEAKRERVMTIHRRPAAENSAIEAAYERRYQHGIDEDQSRKLGALHYNRAVQLRMGNVAKADALAIEEKRRKLDELQEKRETGRLDLSRDGELRVEPPQADRRDHRHPRHEPPGGDGREDGRGGRGGDRQADRGHPLDAARRAGVDAEAAARRDARGHRRGRRGLRDGPRLARRHGGAPADRDGGPRQHELGQDRRADPRAAQAGRDGRDREHPRPPDGREAGAAGRSGRPARADRPRARQALRGRLHRRLRGAPPHRGAPVEADRRELGLRERGDAQRAW